MIGPAARLAIAAILATATLAGCGNDPNADMADVSLKTTVGPLLAALTRGRQPAAAATGTPSPQTVAELRGVLEAAGTPLYAVVDHGTGLASYLGKIGENAGVETWSTTDHLTIAMRDGIIIATRGFGADIMSAVAPGLQTVASGSGQHPRSYFYLDGADQPQRFDYDCVLSVTGQETIEILGKSYETRHIVESCEGSHGTFSNEFWFEDGIKLRQSSQNRVQSVGNMFLQQIIE